MHAWCSMFSSRTEKKAEPLQTATLTTGNFSLKAQQLVAIALSAKFKSAEAQEAVVEVRPTLRSCVDADGTQPPFGCHCSQAPAAPKSSVCSRTNRTWASSRAVTCTNRTAALPRSLCRFHLTRSSLQQPAAAPSTR